MTREEQMMAAAERYVEEVNATFTGNDKEKHQERLVTMNDFAAGWQAADQHPQWIHVEERLPEENGKTQQSVSVWATDGLTSGEFRYNFDTKTWTDMWGDPFDVTHWMPLPEAPRKED